MDAIMEVVGRMNRSLPKFSDGRIDYSASDTAPVVNVFLKFRNRILLLRRSAEVRAYPGKWNCVAGYIDELKPLRRKVLEEVTEETGIPQKSLLSLRFGDVFEFTDRDIGKTWVVQPVLAELKTFPVVSIDWEHTEYRWVLPREISVCDTVPALERAWDAVSSL